MFRSFGFRYVSHFIVVLCLGTEFEVNLGRAALYGKESRHAVICILVTATTTHTPHMGRHAGQKKAGPKACPIVRFDETVLGNEQVFRRVPFVNGTHSTPLGIGLGRELEVRWQPIHLVLAAIGAVQEVFDNALLYLGGFVPVAIGNGG
jgi:hypothetical protein